MLFIHLSFLYLFHSFGWSEFKSVSECSRIYASQTPFASFDHLGWCYNESVSECYMIDSSETPLASFVKNQIQIKKIYLPPPPYKMYI